MYQWKFLGSRSFQPLTLFVNRENTAQIFLSIAARLNRFYDRYNIFTVKHPIVYNKMRINFCKQNKGAVFPRDFRFATLRLMMFNIELA